MNNTNPIFEAMSCLDENYAAESIKPRKGKMKKPLKIAVIAAAFAAALSLLAGFMSSTSDRFRVKFLTKNSSEHGFYLDLKPHEYTIPDEYKSTFTDDHYRGFADILPGELLEKFGLSILTSENFTDTKDVAYQRNYDYTWEPYFDVDEFKATFDYFLRDKKIGANVWFRAEYIADIDRVEISARYRFDENNDPEIITLNDGSPCMVSDTMAVFAYNGVGYRLWFDYGEEQSTELYKQVLADLGIYTPL